MTHQENYKRLIEFLEHINKLGSSGEGPRNLYCCLNPELENRKETNETIKVKKIKCVIEFETDAVSIQY